MKNFSLFFNFLFVAFLVHSQWLKPWIPQLAPGLPQLIRTAVVFVAVNDNVVLGQETTNSQYLRTTHGGENWTVSTVTGAYGI